MAIQILERQTQRQSNPWTGVGDAFAKGRELASDIEYKKGMIEYNKENIKLQAKKAQTEEETAKYDNLAKRYEVASKVMEIGKKYALSKDAQGRPYVDPAKWEKYMTTVVVNDPDLAEVFGSDEMRKMAPQLSPEESFLYGSMGGGSPVEEGNAPNASAAGAVEGNYPVISGGTIKGSMGNYNWTNPAVEAGISRMKSEATEQAKPLTQEESRTLSARNTVGEAVKELNKLVDRGTLDRLTPQTLTDIGQPLVAFFASKDVKDALNYMNHLKNLIPFARGGKQLTPFEAKLVFRLVNTQGKTRAQIKRDLDVYKREFDTMVKAMYTPRGQLNLDNEGMYTFGGGKTYEELVGTKNSHRESINTNSDPLGLFK